MSECENAIDVHSLVVRRGRRRILDINRLTLRSREAVVLLGPNGAGKSTLLKCLLGFMRPTLGTIALLGQPIGLRWTTSLCRIRRRVGYVPQVLALDNATPLTVREVVAIGRTGTAGLFRPLAREDWAMIDAWMERLGLTGLARQAYGDLSGGEQRKVLIAKAMVQEPAILLLDEPTANLDLRWREQIIETLEELYAQNRMAIVLVAHELEVIPPCCRRLLVFCEGKIIGDGSPSQVLSRAMVERLYGSRLRLLATGQRFAAIPAGDASDEY